MSNNDPTNFNERFAAAQKENAEWHRQHPNGALTYKRNVHEMKRIRYAEITRGRTLSEGERDELLASK
jgi:hypothetical protein